MLAAQLLPFVYLRVELLQLADLPSQAFALVGQGALRLLGIGQRLLGLPPSLPSGFERARVGARIGIEQTAHRVGAGQALPGVLAMDVQQLFAQFAQLRGGGGAAVDPGAAFARGVYCAAQQQMGAGLKPGLFEPGLHAGCGFKFGAHLAAAGAFAHHAGFGAGTQGQLQSVDQNGFTRAGLAGQHTKARAQVQCQFVHDHKVAQGDVRQCHGLCALIPVHFFAQSVEIIPARRVQKTHLVLRALHHDPVTQNQVGQRLHVKVGADVAPSHDFDADL